MPHSGSPEPFIRTITGDIAPGLLGWCYSHEHLITDASYATHVFPELCLNSVENGVKEMKKFRDAGGMAVVEATPCSAGRNIGKLVEISRRSGVHIVASTGLHLDKYYAPGHWSRHYGPDELVELFCEDIQTGVDAHDYNGPRVKRTEHRAGIIKMAGSKGRLTRQERELFKVAAVVHRRTGCPILTHTEQGTAGEEQFFLLREEGVAPGKVMLCHLDRNADVREHRKLLEAGAVLEYDSAFRWKGTPENPTLRLIRELLPEFPDQLLLGMDAGRPAYWESYGGGPGLVYLLDVFRKSMEEAGLDAKRIRSMFVENPARLLAFTRVV